MPLGYIVTVEETVTVVYHVIARNQEEAEEVYYKEHFFKEDTYESSNVIEIAHEDFS